MPLDKTLQPAVDNIIKELNLIPHPEGGYYNRYYISDELATMSARSNQQRRACGSSIYFMLTAKNYSAWHKIDADELWCHHEGSVLIIRTLDDSTMELKQYRLGSILHGARPQIIIERGLWFSAELVDQTLYSLVGCQVFPAFEFSGFTLANSDFWHKYENHPQNEIIRQFMPSGVINQLSQSIF